MARIEPGRGVTGFISSSDGSVDVSSSLDLVNADKPYHIRTTNSDLVLSSSATSYTVVSGNLKVLGALSASGTEIVQDVTGSTNFFVTNRLDAQGVLLNSSGNLILSSSAGSIIAISGSLASTGFVSAVSRIFAPEIQPGSTALNRPVFRFATGIHINPANVIGWSPATNQSPESDDIRLSRHSVGFVGLSGSSGSIGFNATSGHLILSSSEGSVIFVSGALFVGNSGSTNSGLLLYGAPGGGQGNAAIRGRGGQLSIENDATVNVRGTTGGPISFDVNSTILTTLLRDRGNAHLILSSSVGTVTISGNLKVEGNIIENASQAGVIVNTGGTIVDTVAAAQHRAAKYIVSISSGSNFQSEEILLLHSGGIADITEYAVLSLPGGPFVGFTATVTGSNVNLIASGSANENTVKFIRMELSI